MIYLLIGEQSLLLKSTLNQIVNNAIDYKDEFNYINLDFENNSLESILDCLQTPAFGSDKKVVIVKNPYFFNDAKKKLPFTNDLTELEQYLYNPNDDCEFIIICQKEYYNPKHKIATILQKIGTVKNLIIESYEDIKDYAQTIMKKLNIDIEPSAFSLLLSRCKDIVTLEKELGKLSLYSNYIDYEAVEHLVPRPLEENVFDLSNAILKKDTKKAMQIYSDLKTIKTEPIALISMLANQFRFMLQVGIIKKTMRSDDEIAKELNAHPYRIKIARENLRKHSINDIKSYLVTLANLDIDIKKGVKDRYIDFELFLATNN